ncbi:unnamed protein product, partial [Urochloa humidicola]
GFPSLRRHQKREEEENLEKGEEEEGRRGARRRRAGTRRRPHRRPRQARGVEVDAVPALLPLRCAFAEGGEDVKPNRERHDAFPEQLDASPLPAPP